MGRVSTGPVSRSARTNPRVRNALSRHSTLGCRCAPRPGSRPSLSRTRTDPRSSLLATMRASSDAGSRCRHPTQVRTGCFRAADGVERTGAAGSDTERDPKTETARLTSPECNRNGRGSRSTHRASGIHSPTPQADTSVSVPSGRHLRVGPDVDTPAGEARGQPGVLAFLADRQRQLVVGDHDASCPRLLVDDDHLAHLRG